MKTMVLHSELKNNKGIKRYMEIKLNQNNIIGCGTVMPGKTSFINAVIRNIIDHPEKSYSVTDEGNEMLLNRMKELKHAD